MHVRLGSTAGMTAIARIARPATSVLAPWTTFLARLEALEKKRRNLLTNRGQIASFARLARTSLTKARRSALAVRWGTFVQSLQNHRLNVEALAYTAHRIHQSQWRQVQDSTQYRKSTLTKELWFGMGSRNAKVRVVNNHHHVCNLFCLAASANVKLEMRIMQTLAHTSQNYCRISRSCLHGRDQD